MKVSQLIEELQKLPQDKPVLCQVCDAQGGAWNMAFAFHDRPGSMVQLRVHHPDLQVLPNIGDTP